MANLLTVVRLTRELEGQTSQMTTALCSSIISHLTKVLFIVNVALTQQGWMYLLTESCSPHPSVNVLLLFVHVGQGFLSRSSRWHQNKSHHTAWQTSSWAVMNPSSALCNIMVPLMLIFLKGENLVVTWSSEGYSGL